MKCAGLRERNCNHSTEGRTGEKATITEKVLHILYTCVRASFLIFNSIYNNEETYIRRLLWVKNVLV